MIGRRIRLKPELPAKISCAMGTPEASVFFDPQNTAAMRSSSEKPRNLQSKSTRSITVKKRKIETVKVIATFARPRLDQTPHFIESQNEV